VGQTHLVGISSDPKLHSRLKLIADEFQFNVEAHTSCEKVSEKYDANTSVRVAVLSVVDVSSTADIAGHLQVLKYACPHAYTILIVDKKLPPDSVGFIKKSGADLIIDETDVFETSFLEFILSQRIKGFMVPVKPQDFKAASEVTFKVLTVLPLNEKYLPVILPNEKLKPGKVEKLALASELYVAREDIDKLQEYINLNCDRSAEGIVSRCRITYMALCKSHTDFIVTLFDKSDRATFSSGKLLLDKSAALASEMLTNLSTLTNPWSVINNGTIGETGSVERSPAIAAMAGLTAMNLNDLNTEDIILAGFLADVGCLTLPPSLLQKIRQGKMAELSEDEQKRYKQHPIYSVNKCLDKKIPLSDKIKAIISTSHERLDGSGFPKNKACDPKSISKESQILQFCEVIDQKLTIKMGEKIENAQDLQFQLLKEEINKKSILDIALAGELQRFLNSNKNNSNAA
jgi:HD domain